MGAKGKKGKAAAAAALAAKKKLKSAQANLKEITIESASGELAAQADGTAQHPRAVHGMALSPWHFATVSYHPSREQDRGDQTRVWHRQALQSAQPVAILGGRFAPNLPNNSANAVAFTPSGHLLAVADGENLVIYDALETFAEDMNDLAGLGTWRCRTRLAHAASVSDDVVVRAVSFSADGALVACGVSDGTVHIWAMDHVVTDQEGAESRCDSGMRLALIEVGKAAVLDVAFLADRRLVTGFIRQSPSSVDVVPQVRMMGCCKYGGVQIGS